jgi:amino acid transporter
MTYYPKNMDRQYSRPAMISARRTSWIAAFQTRTLSALYLISACVCLGFGQGFLSLMFAFAWVYSNPMALLALQNQYHSLLLRLRLNPVMVTGAIAGLLGGTVLGLSWVDPAHAQFFNRAEEFLNSFDGIEPEIVTIVMNTIRALFVMYLIFALVQVINAARQGEEWKDLAKTPFIIVIIGVLGDVLVGAITGV